MKPATRPTFELERALPAPVCGIDEAGRGPLAGPVVAACVHIPDSISALPFLSAVNDSKALSAVKRETLAGHIRTHCAFGTGLAGPEEIDALNIHHATLLAMRRAWADMLEHFGVRPATALIDGKFAPSLSCACETVVKGDSRSLSIAAASILAKTVRDRLMAGMHDEFPHYGWDRNAGYGTAEHLAALKTHGVTPFHRRSFAPVKEALQNPFSVV